MARKNTRAERWWKKFAQSWGSKLAEEYGPTCPEDWADRINRTDDERLEKALTRMRQQTPNWPPTLGQFEAAIPRRELMRQGSVVDRLAVAAASMPTLCDHQRMGPWSYFGSASTNWQPGDYESMRAEIRGVAIAACESCSQPSRRLLARELT